MSDQENQSPKNAKEQSGVTQSVSKELSIVQALAQILNESGVHEIDYEVGDCRIRVAKSPPAARSVVVADHAPDPLAFVPTKVAEKTETAQVPSANEYWVKSPMVGTIYLSPSPNAPTFVTIGGQVQEGQTLLIIEAMKTMNYVKAEKSGYIRDISVKNGSHVEFGQSLVRIE